MAESGEVHAIALECLAERTLVNALRVREANADAGFDPRLARRLRPILPHAARGVAIVTNLGAANPAAAGRAIAHLARDLDLSKLRIAAIVGDDVMHLVDEVEWTESVADGQWIGAHAYLGLEPMVQALAEGADVVVTGRVADSSLVAAAPVQALGLTDGALASALTIGHLLECSGQISGGNLTEPGVADLDAQVPERRVLELPARRLNAGAQRHGAISVRASGTSRSAAASSRITLKLRASAGPAGLFITPAPGSRKPLPPAGT